MIFSIDSRRSPRQQSPSVSQIACGEGIPSIVDVILKESAVKLVVVEVVVDLVSNHSGRVAKELAV